MSKAQAAEAAINFWFWWSMITTGLAVVFGMLWMLAGFTGWRLRIKVEALYYAAYWHPDRSCDEYFLWTEVRDAAGFKHGDKPAKLGQDHTGVVRAA